MTDSPRQPDSSLPLSSLASVPCTPDSRSALADAGLSYVQGMSELTAQSLLALRNKTSPDERPRCYGRQFDPKSLLCGGCLVSPSCWGDDTAYLTRLKAGSTTSPIGAPKEAVDARLSRHKMRGRAKPPTRRKK